MLSLRSALPLIVLTAVPAVAQTRAVDEGTFVVTKAGAPAFTENFKITRRDGGAIAATSHQVAGAQQTTSSLITDTLGTPVQYELHVTERGARVFDVKAEARGGRLVSLSSTKAGDESMRDFPTTPGRSVILEQGLLYQLYFIGLEKRPAAFQTISPRAGRSQSATLTAKGLEPIEIGGKSLTGTHYSLTVGPARYEFWLDAKGRLLRVEIPGDGLVAARDEAPR